MTASSLPVAEAPRASAFPSLQTLAVTGFVLLTLAGFAGAGGGVFAPAWAVAAAATAVTLVWRNPAGYLAFVVSLWFYTPLLRRVLDLHHGFNPTNLALAAPVLASAVAVITLLRFLKELRGVLFAPALLVIAAVTYGFLVGALRNGLVAAFYAYLTWLSPAMVGLHVALHWRRYPDVRQAFLRTLAWGIGPAAAYGVFQFVTMPPWDAFWMVSTDLQSIGRPEPFSVRVFGSMTMPGTFAVVMEVGLLLLLSADVRGRLASLVLGFIGLLLSRIRTAWLGFALGLVLQLVTQPVRRLPRNWLTLTFVAVMALPVITIPRIREGITSRIVSIASGETDSSVRSRVMVARAAYTLVLDYAEGAGLGATGSAVTARRSGGIRNFENGLLEVFFLFGWPGGLLFFLGVAGIVVQGIRLADAQFDPFANAARSGALALLASLLISEIFTGAPGTLFWVLIGFGVSAHAHNLASGATAAYRAQQLRWR
ncbi:MAG: O-antigen ligase family protein [Gemmatimonadaceae bacterium]|nr:O-antigen ligase family protein [Gemmatimonadaceae bacterium]